MKGGIKVHEDFNRGGGERERERDWASEQSAPESSSYVFQGLNGRS